MLSVGSWVFTIALIPSVLSKDKPALSSSAMTAVVLTGYVVVYITLSLWAAASTLLVAGMWYTLAVQKVILDRKVKQGSSGSIPAK